MSTPSKHLGECAHHHSGVVERLVGQPLAPALLGRSPRIIWIISLLSYHS